MSGDWEIVASALGCARQDADRPSLSAMSATPPVAKSAVPSVSLGGVIDLRGGAGIRHRAVAAVTRYLATRGMTVAELIIAIAVVGVLSLVAVPIFSGVRHASLENAALNNVRLINAARDSFALTNPDATTDWAAAANDEERLRLLVGANLLAGMPSDYTAMPGGYSVQLAGPIRSRTVLLSRGVVLDY